jgi:hypothetical protein
MPTVNHDYGYVEKMAGNSSAERRAIPFFPEAWTAPLERGALC